MGLGISGHRLNDHLFAAFCFMHLVVIQVLTPVRDDNSSLVHTSIVDLGTNLSITKFAQAPVFMHLDGFRYQPSQ